MAQKEHSVEFYNGYEMPIVGYGTAMADKEIFSKGLDAALEAGYRHIDTAYLYDTETMIGETLKKWFDSGKLKRQDVFIVTKLPTIANRAECVKKYLKRSLKALQLTYVDLYLIHHPVGFPEGDNLMPKDKNGHFITDPTTDHISLWKAMEAQVDAGRARSIGLSNFNSKQIKRIVKEARIRPANIQVELHIYFQQKELVAFCKALNITVCAYAPLGSPGFKSYLENTHNIKGAKLYTPLTEPVVEKIAKKHKKTPAQVLLRHIMQNGIAVIPKSTNPTRVKENFQVFDFELDDNEMYELNMLDKGSRGRMFTGDIFQGLDKHPEYPYRENY